MAESISVRSGKEKLPCCHFGSCLPGLEGGYETTHSVGTSCSPVFFQVLLGEQNLMMEDQLTLLESLGIQPACKLANPTIACTSGTQDCAMHLLPTLCVHVNKSCLSVVHCIRYVHPTVTGLTDHCTGYHLNIGPVANNTGCNFNYGGVMCVLLDH